MGRRAGSRVWRLGEEPDAPWVVSAAPRHAHLDGFDLHPNVAVPAGDRAWLEQLCRYLLGPAVSQDRLGSSGFRARYVMEPQDSSPETGGAAKP